MKHIRTISFLCCVVVFVCSCTKKLSVTLNSFNVLPPNNLHQQFLNDSIIQALQQQYEFFVLVGYTSNSFSNKVYDIIAKKDRTYAKITYTKMIKVPFGAQRFNLEAHTIKKASGDSLMQLFNTLQLVQIANDNEGCLPAEYGLDTKSKNVSKYCITHDGATSIILINNQQKTTFKAYYDVAFMNQCCPGNNDRAVFLQCWHAVKRIH